MSTTVAIKRCSDHRTYLTRTSARSAARWAQADFPGKVIRAYRCPDCTKFHVDAR